MARVSIVIPAFNAEPYIADTLRSILNSSYQDYEIIVIDDGSKDKTAAVAAAVHPSIRVISQANAGMSASRNRGIAASDSAYIALLDSDDIWHPQKLELQMQQLLARPDHDFAYSAFNVWDGGAYPEFMELSCDGHVDEQHSGWVYQHLILDNLALPSSIVMSRKAWNALGPFSCADQQTDDWDFLVSASRRYKFVRLAESLVLYRQHLSSLSRKLPRLNKHELMRDALLKRFGLQSPDGTPVDVDRLNHFRRASWCNFADGHCSNGDLLLGLSEFTRLLIQGPNRSATASKLSKSMFRRVFPKKSPT